MCAVIRFILLLLGWNHTACEVCTSCSNTLKFCKEAEAYEEAKSKLQDHIALLDACRLNYQCTETKSIMSSNQFERFGINESDVSMVQDASGGTGTVYHPQRKDLLHVKCTFCKIHGHGTYIYVSYSNLEKNGGNLNLEIIYSSLIKYLETKSPGHKIRY